MLFYVPCYNLPKLYAILKQRWHAGRMEVQPSYLSVLKLPTGKPDAEDRPGELVSNAWRLHAGSRVGDNQPSSGF